MDLTVNVIDKNGTSLSVDAIDIGGNLANNTSSHTVTVTDNTTVEVTVTNANYYEYKNKIKVFDFNKTIEIKMIEDSVSDLNADVPSFFYLIEPCSYNIHTYNGSSYPGAKYAYVITQNGNEKVKEASGDDTIIYACTQGSYPVKQRIWDSEVITSNGCTTTNYINQTDSSEETISVDEFKPEISFSKSQSNGCAGNCGFILNEQITVMPTYDFHAPAGCNTQTIDYVVKDYQGNTVSISKASHDINAGDTGEFTFTPDKIGDYTIEAILENCCGKCTYKDNVKIESFYSAKETGCNIIEVHNYSNDESIDYTLDRIDDSMQVETGTVMPGEEKAINNNNKLKDGLYEITITREDGSTEKFSFPLYCDWRTCLNEKLLEVICVDKTDCTEKDLNDFNMKQYELNKAIGNMFLYYNHLNGFYPFGKVFQAVSGFTTEQHNDQITKLKDIDFLQNNIERECSDNNECNDCNC